jgi:hypothetical protein
VPGHDHEIECWRGVVGVNTQSAFDSDSVRSEGKRIKKSEAHHGLGFLGYASKQDKAGNPLTERILNFDAFTLCSFRATPWRTELFASGYKVRLFGSPLPRGTWL